MKRSLLVIMLLVLAGCVEQKARESESIATYDAGTPLTQLTKPVMSINGQVLSEEDFFAFAGSTLREIDIIDANNEVIKAELVQSFIEHYLLLQEAALKNIRIEDERVTDILQNFSQEENAQELRVYAGTYSLDQNELSQLIEERLKVELLLNQAVNNNIEVTEQDIKDYYNANKSKFKQPKRAHIMHIFTTDKETANKALAELKRGISFSEVAERYSEAPERAYGGDLGFVSQADMPDFFSEAFKLRVNRRSPIIKSDYGYHIFLVNKYENAKNLALKDVTSEIHQQLYSQKQEQLTREYIDELFENAIIKNIDVIDFTAFEHIGESSFGSNQ